MDKGELSSEKWCRAFVKRMTSRIGMTSLGNPKSKKLTHKEDPTKSGVSAVQIICESHIAIHTWPEVAGCRVVIDSCKAFSEDTALDEVLLWLWPGRIDIYTATRTRILTKGSDR